MKWGSKMSNIAVIGASSFTGTHFCNFMEERGHNVARISFRGTEWMSDLDRFPFKYIVNFAAANVVPKSWDEPEDYYHVNVTKIAMLAKYLRDKPLTKYVHISTPEVFGNTTEPVTADYYHDPSTPYALSRSCAESLLLLEHKEFGLPVTFTRCANVYGPGQQLWRLIPKVLWCQKKDVPFPLEGGGKAKRAWVYITDVCSAIETVMIRGTSGAAYNISSNERAFPIKDVLYMVLGDNNKMVTNVPGRLGEDPVYELDDFKIRALGWKPEVHLRDGINKVREWMNANWDILKDQSTTYEHKP